MKFDEFVEKVKTMGGVDTDGYYGKQCMDLYNYYCNNVLGVQNVGADCAKNILNNSNIMNNVEKIENYLTHFSYEDKLVIITFNCTEALRDEWENVGDFIIDSLFFTDNN